MHYNIDDYLLTLGTINPEEEELTKEDKAMIDSLINQD